MPRPSLWPALLFALCFLGAAARLHAAESPHSGSLLLIASERLQDPGFRETVVLVTRHGRQGAPVGVIVNRALETTLESLIPDSKEAARHRLYYGGPVGVAQIVFLVRSETAPTASIKLADGLYLGSHGDSLRQLVGAATPASSLRVFRGLASWAPGQLEHEIDRGDWYLLPLDAETLLTDAPEDLWQRLYRRATQLKVRAPVPGQRWMQAGANAIHLAVHGEPFDFAREILVEAPGAQPESFVRQARDDRNEKLVANVIPPR